MKKILALLMTTLVALSPVTFTAVAAPVNEAYTITGLVEGGNRGWAYGAYFGDISKLGYTEDEYSIVGIAKRYQSEGDLSQDGKWTLQVADTVPYKTRILVRKPTDSSKFNGTVIVEWADTSNGYELSYADTQGIYESGFAYVSVTTQQLGIESLRKWDSTRYGDLSIPDDSLSYDIFTQVAKAVGADRSKSGNDPMGGLNVKKLIAVGSSDAGSRILAYINGVQSIEHTFDALMPVVSAGKAFGFNNETQKFASMVRDDQSVPVMVINSQTEALAYEEYRQPDTAVFRSWEIAGASHTPDRQARYLQQKTDRDGVTDWGVIYEKYIPNKVNWLYTLDAAFLRVNEWITEEKLPPQIAPIEINDSAYVLDEHGNVLGGVRLPEVEVPAAQYAAGPDLPLTGYSITFSPDELIELYPKHEDYVTKITDAAKKAEDLGVILPYRTQEYTKMAENTSVPVMLKPDLTNKILNYVIIGIVVLILVIAFIVFLIVRKVRRKKKTKKDNAKNSIH